MYDRMQTLTTGALEKIHDASLEILQNTGVAFQEQLALETFRKNGFKVDGATVFFSESQIEKCLASAPSRFTLHARNPVNNVEIGDDDFVFVPAYGAPFIALPDGSQRPGTLSDYEDFCKLVQSSKYVDMNGYLMVEPSDTPAATAGLDMVLANLLLCDKPFMGCQTNRAIANDLTEMLAIAFCRGNKEQLVEKPCSVSLINSLSPLQYSEEMAGALMELAAFGQPAVIANMVIGGTSGPVRLPGIMTLINAEVLAGIALAQLVNPGTPVIYGSTSTVTNFKTGAALVGVTEQAQLVSLTAQMARFYKLPCRSGGGLCDAYVPDAQASYESAMHLITAVRNGVNFILHSCGQMAGHLSVSFEKFLLDEEFCGMLRKLVAPVEINEENLDTQTIAEIGIGGQYLSHPKTFKLCRSEYHQQELFSHDIHDTWKAKGSHRIDETARDKVKQRLEQYRRPEIDPQIEKKLTEYVKQRKSA
ncbi:trimethylamine methyltransferase family protein [Desulforhopalus singaporensis]|uniref:Methyltransferase n=1 Tax=Desulforhopalus singaporensis TaxID=91360 RepID=A0A1H0U2L7_9BACT|nr:trimethylamine methyltransferase family protein [Desulforhopalus singaporensis]SDP60542.1 trimethylamine---corrinoid protein Co-methyltransferase [Desulforhopalus singaporensis]